MFESLAKLNTLYGHYFGLRGENAKRTLALLGIISINILLAFVHTFINSTFTSFIGILDLPDITYTAFFGAATDFLGLIMVYSAIASFNSTLSELLGESLAVEKTKELNARWHAKNIPFLYKFIKESDKLNPADIITGHSRDTAEKSISLLNSLISQICNSIVGFIGLWRLSSTLIVVVLGTPLSIPGYMALAACTYSLGYNIIMGCIGGPLHGHRATLRQLNGASNAQLHHTHVFAEPIAMRQGANFELNILNKLYQAEQKVFKSFFVLNGILDFIRTVHQELSFAMGLFLSAPQIIAKKITTAELFVVSGHFTSVVGLFTWQHNNFEKTTGVAVGAQQLTDFENILTQCENLDKSKKYKTTYNSENKQSIIFNNLTVKTPTGITCSHFDSLEIPFNENSARIKITGKTGLGKTTLLRMLANIWPYGEGNLSFPVPEEKISCLSQEACFALKSTLLEAILYPSIPTEDNLKDIDIKQIKTWMEKLDLAKHIDALNNHQEAEWGKLLSGGEKQRIALLSILVKAPKMAILDESLSALDPETTQDVFDLLKTTLPHTTFLCVDHAENQKNDFYTHVLALKEGECPTLTPIQGLSMGLAM